MAFLLIFLSISITPLLNLNITFSSSSFLGFDFGFSGSGIGLGSRIGFSSFGITFLVLLAFLIVELISFNCLLLYFITFKALSFLSNNLDLELLNDFLKSLKLFSIFSWEDLKIKS